MDRFCGKYIYIKEYHPKKPTTSVSKHNKSVKIFKQDYSKIFLSLPIYKLAKEKIEHKNDDYYRNKHSLIEKNQ